MTIKSIL